MPASMLTPERLSDEHRLIAQTAREFAEKEVIPAIDRLEQKDWALARQSACNARASSACSASTRPKSSAVSGSTRPLRSSSAATPPAARRSAPRSARRATSRSARFSTSAQPIRKRDIFRS